MKYKLSFFLIFNPVTSSIGVSQTTFRNVKITVGQAVYDLPASTRINGEIDWHFVIALPVVH